MHFWSDHLALTGFAGGLHWLQDSMGPIGHCAVGMSAKRYAPQAPMGILFLATFFLDLMAIALGYLAVDGTAVYVDYMFG